MRTTIQPDGVIAAAFNPLAVALALNAGFVARGFSGDGDQLCELIQSGIRHRGFALIDILQPCVSFNRFNTHKWYQERIEKIDKTHDTSNRTAALRIALQEEDRIPTGIFYRRERPTFTDHIDKLKDRALIDCRYQAESLREILREHGSTG
jgi:2-oxoglutarate ferredoxin oxidoreductase subunit beta